MHNMAHAAVAYFGSLSSCGYIAEAIGDCRIKYLAAAALERSALALHKEHGADISALCANASNLIYRFSNAGLKDTVVRVGRDTKRKLSGSDRLIGAIKLAKKHGVSTVYHCAAAAAALLFRPEGDEASREVASYAETAGARAALQKYSDFTADAECALVGRLYAMMGAGAPLEEIIQICEEAENLNLKL